MSVDLDIRLTQDVRIGKLKTGIQDELKALTNLSTIPNVEIKQMNDGILYETDDSMILKPHEAYYVNFIDTEETVGLVITELKLQPPYITEEEAGLWFGIVINGQYPVKFLLGGAIACYVSRLCEGKIFDESCFWSNDRENDFDTFLAFIKSDLAGRDSSDEDIQIASEKFYNSLPRG